MEKLKVELFHDSHNAWKPAQHAGFHIPPATAAAGTIKTKAAEPLESGGLTDSRAEPINQPAAVTLSLPLNARAIATSVAIPQRMGFDRNFSTRASVCSIYAIVSPALMFESTDNPE